MESKCCEVEGYVEEVWKGCVTQREGVGERRNDLCD